MPSLPSQFISRIPHYVVEDDAPLTISNPEFVILHTPLAPDGHAFLEKILTAFGWNPMVIEKIELKLDERKNLAHLWSQKQLKIVLFFGVNPYQVGIFIQPLPSHVIAMPFYVYITESIENIGTSNLLKKKLWEDLKGLSM